MASSALSADTVFFLTGGIVHNRSDVDSPLSQISLLLLFIVYKFII